MDSSLKKAKVRYTACRKTENIGQERKKRKLEISEWKEQKLVKKLEKQLKQKSDKNIHTVADDTKSCHKGRNYTISIAVPGSILNNAQSQELKTYLVGQIARAAVIYNVDEVIVFDDTNSMTKEKGIDEVLNFKSKACLTMYKILQYLDCPQYLRKIFFPHQSDLQYAGLLNPLDAPHHMRIDDDSLYREGVVLSKPVKSGRGSYVNVGMRREVEVDKQIQDGVRVTVRINKLKNSGDKDGGYPSNSETKKITGRVVPWSEPRLKHGIYWGYRTRLAADLDEVLRGKSAVAIDGYDCIIGTSEKGEDIDHFNLPSFKHLLMVFGGLSGLEACIESNESTQLNDPSEYFHHYLNTCPNQGSRTIRTEEAILISLSCLRGKIVLSPSNVH